MLSSTPQFDIDSLPDVAPRAVQEYGCGGRIRIEAIIQSTQASKFENQIVTVCGWSKTIRKQGAGLVFIALNDGSTAKTLQVVVSASALEPEAYAVLQKCGVSCSFRITGTIVPSPAKGQTYEMQVNDKELHSVKVYGDADQAKFPLAKKAHSKEFLREIQHLRARSYIMGVATRIRSALAAATHEFFQSRGFLYLNTPIITCSDCEGAGEMFQVTTMLPEDGDISKIPKDPKTGKILYKKDFFGRKAMLTVSGQLNSETYIHALSDIYTLGPAFRAEESHTSRHLAEFWMMEPEMAFADLEDCMKCAESYLRFCVQYVLVRHREDLEWLQSNVEDGLIARLTNISQSKFARATYTEAIAILEGQAPDRFQVKPEWGIDLGTEHERFLSEEHFKCPVIVTDYPYDLKAFYMKVNEDKKTVRAMDILVPKVGEIAGGSQREENLDLLDKQIRDKGLNIDDYWWYRDLRKFGTVPHSGFGVGFERLIMMVTGIENIRDVIAFPRTAGSADF